MALGAGILLNQIKVLDRHEQLVLTGIAELHKLVKAIIDGDPREADELPDAVVDMDDVITHLEIAQVREEGTRDRSPLVDDPRFLVEQVGLGVDLEAGFRQPEAARELTGGHQQRCCLCDLGTVNLDRGEAMLAQELGDPLRAPRRGGHEQLGFPARATVPHLTHPIAEPPVEGQRRLARNTMSIDRRVCVEDQGLEPRDRRQPRPHVCPGDDQGVRWRCGLTPGDESVVARLDLLDGPGDAPLALVYVAQERAH